MTVQFTDGVDTFTEVVKPMDENGFNYFVKERLTSLNTAKKLETDDNLGKPIVVDPVVPVDTPEVIYARARYGLIELKQDVELGLATQTQYDAKRAEVIALKPGAVIKG